MLRVQHTSHSMCFSLAQQGKGGRRGRSEALGKANICASLMPASAIQKSYQSFSSSALVFLCLRWPDHILLGPALC